MGNILYYGGIAVISIAAILGITAFFVFRTKAKRLNQILAQEYGERLK